MNFLFTPRVYIHTLKTGKLEQILQSERRRMEMQPFENVMAALSFNKFTPATTSQINGPDINHHDH